MMMHPNLFDFPSMELSINPYPNTLFDSTVKEVQLITKASVPLVTTSVLGAISTAIQGFCDVELPIGKICPVSLNLLTIAESGERKSTVENLAMEGIRLYQKESQQSYAQDSKQYEILLASHNRKERELQKKLDKSDDSEASSIVDEILSLEVNKPKAPKEGKLIYEDVTPEALMFGLSEDTPHAYLGSSEGGVLFDSRIMQETAKLNALWSGDDISICRKTVSDNNLSGTRLTTHIMTQPSALFDFQKKSKADVRGNGYFSRFLICLSPVTSGYREITAVKYTKENIELFNKKTIKLLKRAGYLTSDEKVVMQFSDEAKDIWFAVSNDIERKMQPNQKYYVAKDHASKLPENIARIAALLECFENGCEAKISASSLNQAIYLAAYFSNDFLKVFCPPPKHVVDGNNLNTWLHQLHSTGKRYLTQSYILQYGPNSVRKKAYVEQALEYLRQSNYLTIWHVGKSKVIDLYVNTVFDWAKLVQDTGLKPPKINMPITV